MRLIDVDVFREALNDYIVAENCDGDYKDGLIEAGLMAMELPKFEQPQWISVDDERKPKDRREYFVSYVFGESDMHFYGSARYHAHEGNGLVDRPHFSNEGVDRMRVTHWMEIPPLPMPPKGDER